MTEPVDINTPRHRKPDSWIEFDPDQLVITVPPPDRYYDIPGDPDLFRPEQFMSAGISVYEQIQEVSQYLSDAQLARFIDWAGMHPTTDPRTWMPVALTGVRPTDNVAGMLSAADIAMQMETGQWGLTLGGSIRTATDYLDRYGTLRAEKENAPTIEQNVEITKQLGEAEKEAEAQGIDVREYLQRQEKEALEAEAAQKEREKGTSAKIQAGVGFGFSAMLAPNEFKNAAIRDRAAIGSVRGQVKDKYRLEGNEEAYVFGQGAQLQARGISTAAIGAFKSSRQPDLIRAKAEYRELLSANRTGSLISAYEQTQLGQTTKDWGHLTEGRGKWFSLTSYMPSVTYHERQSERARQAFDWRSADEIRKGIAQSAATPGRLVTSGLDMDPESSMFNLVSGTVDFFNSTVGDPVTYIPGGQVAAVGRGLGQVTRGGLQLTARELDHLGVVGSRAAEGLRYASEYTPGFTWRAVRGKEGEEMVAVRAPGLRPPGARVRGGEAARQGAQDAFADAVAGGMRGVNDPELLASVHSASRIDPITGLVRNGFTGYVMRQAAWEFLFSRRGSLLVDRLVQETSPSRIRALSNRKFDDEISNALAQATTASQVRAVLGSRMGNVITDPRAISSLSSHAPAIFRAGVIRDSWARNLFRESPGNVNFDMNNKALTVDTMERFGRSIGLNWSDMEPHLDLVMRAAGAQKSQQQFDALEGYLMGPVYQRMLSKAGSHTDPNDLRSILRNFQGGLDDAQRTYAVRDLPSGGYGAKPDGTPDALLESEMFKGMAILPNLRRIQRTIGMTANIRRSFGFSTQGDDMVANFVQGTTSAWRTAVLLRPAYILRTVGEEIFAMGLAGYSSMFTAPITFVAMATAVAAGKESTNLAGRLVSTGLTGRLPGQTMAALRERGLFPHQELFDLRQMTAAAPRSAKAGLYRRQQELITRAALRKSGSLAARMPYVAAAVNPLALANRFTMGAQGINLLWNKFDLHQARVMGDDFWGNYIDAANGSDRGLHGLHDGMAAVSSTYLRDESSGRAAATTVKQARRDDLNQRPDYHKAITDKYLKFGADRDVQRLLDPALSRAEQLAAFRATTRERKMARRPDLLGAPGQDLDYLNGMAHNIDLLTVGDGTLAEALRTGMFAGQKIGMKNAAWRRKLDEEIAAQPDNFSPVLNYREFNHQAVRRLNKVVDDFFMVGGEWADIFARGPLLRQAYVAKVREIGSEMSLATKQQIVANLHHAGDVKLARVVQNVRANGTLTVEEVDGIAAGFAKQEMRRVFYDAHRRQNWAQALRVLSPFAQATMNTFRRWGQMSLSNPQFAYRAIKPLYYLTQPGSAAIYSIFAPVFGLNDHHYLYDPGHPETTVAKDGFFFTNDFNERQFAMPVVGAISKLFYNLLPGPNVEQPEGMVSIAKLTGLNVAGTSFYPGSGPFLTIAASAMFGEQMKSTDKRGEVLRYLNPYGLPQGNVAEKFIAAFFPTIIKRLIVTTDPEEVGRRSIIVMNPMIESGDYDVKTKAGQNKLYKDAADLSQRIGILNAVGSFIAPATYQTDVLVDVNGGSAEQSHVMLQTSLAALFNKYIDGPGPEPYTTGVLHFVKDFGVLALFSALPATQSRGRDGLPGPQATRDVWEFMSSHPTAYDDYLGVIGLFFPGGAADTKFLRIQRESGQRVRLTPEERLQQVSDTIGWALYNSKYAEVTAMGLPKDQQRRIMAEVVEDIEAQFPLWTNEPKQGGRITDQMGVFREAVQDKGVLSIPSAKYIKAWVQLYDDAVIQVQEAGVSASGDLTVEGADNLALNLAETAQDFMAADTSGGFRNAYNQVFAKLLPEELRV